MTYTIDGTKFTITKAQAEALRKMVAGHFIEYRTNGNTFTLVRRRVVRRLRLKDVEAIHRAVGGKAGIIEETDIHLMRLTPLGQRVAEGMKEK